MPAGDVKRLAALGFEIGFHTLRHDRLTDLADDELREALEEGRDQLAAAGGATIASVAYPHGAADRRVASAARAAGYRTGFTANGGAVRPNRDPHRIPRLTPPHGTEYALAEQLVRTLVGRGQG